MAEETISRLSSINRKWTLCEKAVPKQEIIFFTQVILIYTVVIACIVNLSFAEENQALWSSLLSACVGYLLPSPTLKKRHDSLLSHTTEQ